MGSPKYVVRTMLNLTAGSGRLPRNFSSTQRVTAVDAFDTLDDAMIEYHKLKSQFKYIGVMGHYVAYPVLIENYEPEPIPTKWCDECGEPIVLPEPTEDGTTPDEGYTDLPNGDFCSKRCFRNAYEGRSEDDNYEDEDFSYGDDY